MAHLLEKNRNGKFSTLNRFQKKPTYRLALEHPGERIDMLKRMHHSTLLT